MSEAKIYSAIANVMSEIGAVGKDGRNDFGKYKYRSIDAVMNALHPAMVKNRVFTTPEVLEQVREDRVSRKNEPMVFSVAKVKYVFYADDGSSVSATVIGEGSDAGDKSMNKAMSAAFKYACFQVFCIPTEEMIDSEQDNPEFAAPQQASTPAPQPMQKPDIPCFEYAASHQLEFINNVQQEALVKKASGEQVPIEGILAVFRNSKTPVTNIAELQNFRYIDIMATHWDAYKKSALEWAAANKTATRKVNINDL